MLSIRGIQGCHPWTELAAGVGSVEAEGGARCRVRFVREEEPRPRRRVQLVGPTTEEVREAVSHATVHDQLSGNREVRPSALARLLMCRRTFARSASEWLPLESVARPTALIAFDRSERLRIGNLPPGMA